MFGVEVVIAGVYAPNSSLVQFWNNFFLAMGNLTAKNILLLGDFNAVIDPELDSSK